MAKTTLPGEAIRSEMIRLTGEVGEFTQLVEGEESQAFAFNSAGDRLVVRVNRRSAGFRRDRWAAERLCDELVPVPRVRHIGQIDERHHYCVTERAPGVVLQDLPDAELRDLVAPVTAVLTAIAATDVSAFTGYGSFDPATETGESPSWSAVVGAPADLDWSGLDKSLDGGAIAELIGTLEELTAELPDFRQLIHGDFGANNVLAQSGRVTAVLDWEAAMIGDSRYDVAYQAFWAPFLPRLQIQSEHLLAEYADSGQPDWLRCYLISIGLRAVNYYAAAGRIPEAQAMLYRTRKANQSD